MLPDHTNGTLNTFRARQNGRHFTDYIFKCIFLYENVWIPIWISLKFAPKGPIKNIPTLVQRMAWRRPGDKPLSESMMVRLPTHICVTRPQWDVLNLFVPQNGYDQRGRGFPQEIAPRMEEYYIHDSIKYEVGPWTVIYVHQWWQWLCLPLYCIFRASIYLAACGLVAPNVVADMGLHWIR